MIKAFQWAGGQRFAIEMQMLGVHAIVVVAFNRTVWRYCYRLAEERFSLNK